MAAFQVACELGPGKEPEEGEFRIDGVRVRVIAFPKPCLSRMSPFFYSYPRYSPRKVLSKLGKTFFRRVAAAFRISAFDAMGVGKGEASFLSFCEPPSFYVPEVLLVSEGKPGAMGASFWIFLAGQICPWMTGSLT